MVNRWQVGGIAGGAAIIIIAFLTLTAADYREILASNPSENLFVILNQTDRIELLSRSVEPNIEFVRWQYRDDYVKVYFGSNLVGTSKWKVFNGSRQVVYREETQPYTLEDNTIRQSFAYYFDSRHTRPAGVLRRTIQIYPETAKESVEWFPIDQKQKYNVRWEVADLDTPNTTIKSASKRVYDNGFTADWTPSAGKISAVQQTKNKLTLIYKSEAGYQKIDPEIGTLKVDDYIKIDRQDKICAYNNPNDCYPEFKITNPGKTELTIPCGNVSFIKKTKGANDLFNTLELYGNHTETRSKYEHVYSLRNVSKTCMEFLNVGDVNATCVYENGTVVWSYKFVSFEGNKITYEALVGESMDVFYNVTVEKYSSPSCPIVIPSGGDKTFRFKYKVSPWTTDYYIIPFLNYIKDPFLNGTLYQQTFDSNADVNYSKSFNVTVVNGQLVPNSTVTATTAPFTAIGKNFSAYDGTEQGLQFLFHLDGGNTSSAINVSADLAWGGTAGYQYNNTDVFSGNTDGSKGLNTTVIQPSTRLRDTATGASTRTNWTVELRFKLPREFNGDCLATGDITLFSTTAYGAGVGTALFLYCGGNMAGGLTGAEPLGTLILKTFAGDYYQIETNCTYGVQGFPADTWINVSFSFNDSQETIICNGVENVSDTRKEATPAGSNPTFTTISLFNNQVATGDAGGNVTIDEVAVFDYAKNWRQYQAAGSGSAGDDVTNYSNGTFYSVVVNETVQWNRMRINVNVSRASDANLSFLVCDGTYSSCNFATPGEDVVPSGSLTGLTYIVNFTTTNRSMSANLSEINISLVPPPPSRVYLYVEGVNTSNFSYEIYTTANVSVVSTTAGDTVCATHNGTMYCGASPLYLNLTHSVLNVRENNESLEVVIFAAASVANKTNLTIRFDNRTDLVSSKVRLNGSANGNGEFPRNITINSLAPEEEGNNASLDIILPGELQGRNLTQIQFWQSGTLYNVLNLTMVARSRQTIFLNLTNSSFVDVLQWHNVTFAFRGYSIDLTNQLSFLEDFNTTDNITAWNVGYPVNPYFDSFEGGDGLSRNADRYDEGGNCEEGTPNISSSNVADDGFLHLKPTKASGVQACHVTIPALNMKVVKNVNVRYQSLSRQASPGPGQGARQKFFLYDGTNAFNIGTYENSGNSNITVNLVRVGTSTSPSYKVTFTGVPATTFTPTSSDLDFSQNWSLRIQAEADDSFDWSMHVFQLNASGIILPYNDTGGFTANKTFNISSGTLENTTEVISRAKLCCSLQIDDGDANTELYLSANNGTNWEKTSNCDFLAFANSGGALKWRVGMNSSNGYDTDYVTNCSVEVVSGSVKNVSVDLGDDGSFEYQVNETVNSTNNLDASVNSTALQAYVARNCPGRTCWVPIAVQTDGGGILQLNVTLPQTLGFIDVNSSSWETRQTANAEFSWSNGRLTVTEMQNLYRGSFNSTVFANVSNSLTLNTYAPYNATLFVKYSKFRLDFPANISTYSTTFTNRTQFNVTPRGQTTTRGIFNITSLSYDRKMDFYVWINGTINATLNITANASNFSTSEEGLRLYWRLDNETSDVSGYENLASQKGGVNCSSSVTGILGKACDFDGSGDYLTAGANTTLDSNKSFTIEAWIYARDGFLGSGQPIVTKMENYGTGRNGYALMYRRSSCAYMVADASGFTEHIGVGSTLNVNTWYHLALTYNGATMVCYVNGTTESSQAATRNATSYGQSFDVGGSQAGTDGDFDGFIDEVKFWNRPLSQAEIQANYLKTREGIGRKIVLNSTPQLLCKNLSVQNLTIAPVLKFVNPTSLHNTSSAKNWTYINVTWLNTSTPAESFTFNWNGTNISTRGLVGLWHFNNNSWDYSAAGNNNLSGSANCSTSITGKFGKACSFNIGENFNITPSPFTAPISNFTMMAWVMPGNLSQNGIFFYSDVGRMGVGIGGAAGENTGQDLRGIYDGVSWLITGIQFPDNSSWHHVAITRMGNTTRIYFDAATNSSFTFTPAEGTVNKASIAASQAGGRNFFGKIDEVRFYTRALSSAEINASYLSEFGKYNDSEVWYINQTEKSGNFTYYAWINDTSGSSWQTETRSVILNSAGNDGGYVLYSSAHDARYCNIFNYANVRNISSRIQRPYFQIVSICDTCVRTWDFHKTNPLVVS